ncbi:MAG: ABC transporter ATP-binding protein [Clostridia bacterium]
MISVQNVTKRYGDTVGVQDVSFEVGEGEILGFLGPNGAGKTTTMRVITGYHPPTSGTVTVAGYDIVTQSHEAKRHLGYLPENPPLYADMTVAEYLHFVAALKEVPRKERRGQIDEIVDMLNLGPVYQRLIRNISKGYRQRVGLAQALVGRPPVLILDEPTVGLDPKQIHEVRQVIKSLGGRHTIILSSHILPEVSMVCQRIAIINKGRIVAVDHPETLSSRLRGNTRVIARIEGDPERVREAMLKIDGVLSVAHRQPETGPDGAARYEIEVEGKKDVRRNLFFAMAAIEAPILELRSVEMSLEDVFLQLTTDEAVEAGDESTAGEEEVVAGA